MQSHLPPSNDSLDQDERELLEAVESGALRSIATPDLLNQLRESAQVTGQKDQRINIRLSGTDLEALRVRALRLGMPYQTLISSVLHRYISGELSDEQLVRSVSSVSIVIGTTGTAQASSCSSLSPLARSPPAGLSGDQKPLVEQVKALVFDLEGATCTDMGKDLWPEPLH